MSKTNRTSCFLEGRGAIIVVFLCSLFFSFLIFCHDDTYALDKHDYVKKITSFGVKTWCGDHNNGAGKTLFNVGVKWGDLCKDGACSFTSSFSCQNAGLACATTGNVTGFSVTKKKTTKKYEYYRLYVRTDSGYQDAAATFRRKISNDADLTLYAYDKTFGRWMFDGEPQDYDDSGTKDTVWANSDVFDGAPYEIDLWSTDEPIKCPGGTVGWNDWATAYSCTVKNARDDVEATSYYQTYPIYVTVYGLIQGTNTYVRTVKDLQYKRPRLADYKRSYGGYDDEAYEKAEHDYMWCKNNERIFIRHTPDGYVRLKNFEAMEMMYEYKNHQCASFEEEVDIPARIASTGSAYYGRSATTGSVPDTIVAMDGKEYYFNGWSNCNDTYVVNGDKQVAYHNDAKRTCTVGPIERDMNVYALYGQKQIAGRAVASSGSVSADTGYVGENTTKDDTKIDCNNNGCNVAFKVYLKAVRGSGATPFSTDTNSTVSSPFTPSAAGNEVGNVSQVLKPGEKACKLITFHPFGQYDENVTKTAKSCLTAKVTNFNGRISVIGADPGTNDSGWSNSNKQVNTYVDKCSPVTGCKVSFKHEMEQTNSIGSTGYTIKRTSNLTDAAVGERAISANNNLANGEFGGSIGTRTVKEDNDLTLYPGMKVCESMTFKPNNSYTNPASDVTVTTCVHANGNAQPPDPPNPTTEEPPSSSFTGDGAFVNIKVRNASVAKYNNYQQTVFAKPGDNVEYRASYNPILQYTYFLKPDKMKIDNGGLIAGNGSILGKLFNDKKPSGIPDWNNGFSILMGESSQLSYHKYNVGLTKLQSPDPNSVAIKPGDVGREIKERAITSYGSEKNVRTTPSQVSFDDKQNSVGQVITQSIYRDALAKVPYNFELETEVTTPDTEPVFAGGEFTFKYDLIVKERTNITLDGTYATRVDNPKVKIGISYYGDKGDIGKYIWSKEKSMDSLNKDNALHNPPVTVGPDIKINIPDLNAGERICIRSAVFPKDSHDDFNMNPSASYDLNDPNSWSYSAPICYSIAKRPSIQVWGGNVFSGGTIATPRSVKNNLYEYVNYAIEGSTKTYTFGSWGELGVISRGEVRGFASGATLGYVSNDGSGNLNPVPYKYLLDSAPNTRARVGDKPGGSDKNDFCWHSLLTIANNNCSGGVASGTGDTDATDGIKLDKDALEALTKNAITEQGIPGNKIKLDDAINEVLYSTDGDVEVQGGTLHKHAFKIVSSKNGNVTITGNIQIEESETFEKFSHSPKAVIYADNTIFIDCSVSRIDALLVARRVVTCNNFAGDGSFSNGNIKASINDELNSNQLIVNGAIVANKLYANRTYGAAKGANSMVPAEIINFDPILYLWGGVAGEKKTDEDDDKKVINGNMEMTFVHEIAPRY